MDIRYKLYPYPVLAAFNDSYIDSKFEVQAVCGNEGYDVSITTEVILENDQLMEMVKVGDAIILYHLECAQSGYRKIITTDNFNSSFVIRDDLLNGELHFCPFIVANKTLHNYYNDKFHPDYEFPIPIIEKGFVLAVGKQRNWTIEKKISDLTRSASPFRILKNMDTSHNEMVVEFESEPRIKIKLNEEDFSLYKKMKKNPSLRGILNSAIVVPALIYVLGKMQQMTEDDMESDFGKFPWYISIKSTLVNSFGIKMDNLKDENAFELAQKLLRTPINEAIMELANIGDRNGEEDDAE